MKRVDFEVAEPEVPASETAIWQAPDGYTTEWYEDTHCRPATLKEHVDRKCRRPDCDGRPVLAMHRSNGWWLYCAEHLYGRRIRHGIVEMRRFIPKTDEA